MISAPAVARLASLLLHSLSLNRQAPMCSLGCGTQRHVLQRVSYPTSPGRATFFTSFNLTVWKWVDVCRTREPPFGSACGSQWRSRRSYERLGNYIRKLHAKNMPSCPESDYSDGPCWQTQESQLRLPCQFRGGLDRKETSFRKFLSEPIRNTKQDCYGLKGGKGFPSLIYNFRCICITVFRLNKDHFWPTLQALF